jgi:hypothetical protein
MMEISGAFANASVDSIQFNSMESCAYLEARVWVKKFTLNFDIVRRESSTNLKAYMNQQSIVNDG